MSTDSFGLISVILPAFNELENLKSLIPSIESNLSGHEFEIILVDDRSPDQTYEYFKKLSKENLLVSYNKYPKGLANSIKHGIEISKGDMAVVDTEGMYHRKISI